MYNSTEALEKVFDTVCILDDNYLPQSSLSVDNGLSIVAGQDGIGKSTLGKMIVKDIANLGIAVTRRKINWGMEETQPEKTLMDIAHSDLSTPIDQAQAFAILSQLSFQRARQIDRPGLTVFDRGDERYFAWGLTQVFRGLMSSSSRADLIDYFKNLQINPNELGWKRAILDDIKRLESDHTSISSFFHAMVGATKREELLRTGMITGFTAPRFRLQIFCTPEETWRRIEARQAGSQYDPQSAQETMMQVFIQEYADRRIAAIPVIGQSTTVMINNDGKFEELGVLSSGVAEVMKSWYSTRVLEIPQQYSHKLAIAK